MKTLVLFLSLAVLSLAGCDRAAPPASNLPTATLPIGVKTYTLEIAAKELDRNKGLMYRDAMPADHGMVFVFAVVEDRSFWMRNTRIPLDILFLDATGKIVSIHRMEPYDERGTKSKAPAKYAIELNAGEAGAAKVSEGQRLVLPEGVRNARGDP